MRVGSADPARAVRQHCTFVRTLRRLGADVELVPFVHGAYDSVFAKDSAVLRNEGGNRTALLANPRYAERQAEQRSRRCALEAAGFRVTPWPSSPLEGGDVVFRAGERPRGYLGHGFRSARESVGALERFFDAPFTPIELRDPALYHLDMAVACLGPWTLVCEEALTPASLRDLERMEGRDALVPIPLVEALHFALNFVAVGASVVFGAGVPTFEERLARLGYQPLTVPLSEFQLAGGSAACLVSRVHARGEVTVRSTAAMRSTAA